jgi:hypothetical protein
MRTLLAAALLAATALPAAAAPEPVPLPTWCVLHGDEQTAVVASGPITAVDVAPADVLANPVPISVVCRVEVWDWSTGAQQSYTTPPANGLAVAAVPPTRVPLAITQTSVVDVCTEVRVTDAHGVTRTYQRSPLNGMWFEYSGRCLRGAECLALDAYCNYELALVAWVVAHTGLGPDSPDPTLCPLLAGASPGVPGTVDVDPTGDTAVGGQPFWDCPPYGG